MGVSFRWKLICAPGKRNGFVQRALEERRGSFSCRKNAWRLCDQRQAQMCGWIIPFGVPRNVKAPCEYNMSLLLNQEFMLGVFARNFQFHFAEIKQLRAVSGMGRTGTAKMLHWMSALRGSDFRYRFGERLCSWNGFVRWFGFQLSFTFQETSHLLSSYIWIVICQTAKVPAATATATLSSSAFASVGESSSFPKQAEIADLGGLNL